MCVRSGNSYPNHSDHCVCVFAGERVSDLASHTLIIQMCVCVCVCMCVCVCECARVFAVKRV